MAKHAARGGIRTWILGSSFYLPGVVAGEGHVCTSSRVVPSREDKEHWSAGLEANGWGIIQKSARAGAVGTEVAPFAPYVLWR